MEIGTFGDIVFEVSDKRILTPTSMTRSGEAVWADHPMLYKKPKREFMHSALRKIEMEIKLRASFGVPPEETIRQLYKYMENGKRFHLIIGGKNMSNYKMSIMTISDGWNTVTNTGELIQATVNISFEETK